MAAVYIDDAGSATDPFDTWAKAAASLTAALGGTGFVAGDAVYVISTNVEGLTGAQTWTFPGTMTAPTPLISSTTGDVYATGAKFNTDNTITVNGSIAAWGITFDGTIVTIGQGNQEQIFNDGTFTVSDQITVATGSAVDCYNCNLTCTASAGPILVGPARGNIRWRGGTWTGSSLTSGEVITVNADGVSVIIEDVDLSAMNTVTKLATDISSGAQACYITFRRCKLPASYTMPAVAGMGGWILLESCAAGTLSAPATGLTHFRDGIGEVTTDTAQYRTGGASDGTTSYSWKINTNGTIDASIHRPLRTPPIAMWISAVTSQTLTVYLNSTDAALTDKDVWLEISKLKEGAAEADNDFVDTMVTDIRAAGTALTSDASTWVTANTKYKIEHTIDPADGLVGGMLVLRVVLAKDATIVNVDPKLFVA